MSKTEIRQEVFQQAYNNWNTVFGVNGLDPENGVISPDDIYLTLESRLNHKDEISQHDRHILSEWALRMVLREREDRDV